MLICLKFNNKYHRVALRFGLKREELEGPLHAHELCGVPGPQRAQLGLLERRLQRPPLGVEAQDALQQRVRPDRQSVNEMYENTACK